MGSYLRLLLLVADWPLAHRSPTIADSLVHLVSGTPRYEMIIYNQAPTALPSRSIFPGWGVYVYRDLVAGKMVRGRGGAACGIRPGPGHGRCRPSHRPGHAGYQSLWPR